MKKKHSLVLLSLLQAISIILFIFYNGVFFSIGFDAADNYWTFARYYFAIYPYEIVFMCISLIALILSVFLKNILNQEKGRTIMVLINYNIKLILGLCLLSSLSGMHTVLNLNDFRAYLPISFLISVSTIILIMIVGAALIRELITKYKMSNSI